MFYREADINDFYKECDYLKWRLGEDVIKLLEDGSKMKAVKLLRDKFGTPLMENKKLLDRYVIFKNAYEDFSNGKTVYTEYTI